ncbi:MAG: hypothetical protein IJ615_03550 [Bacteroidaceae bacterium]|nr:hypothetical protein [Bacteroidaceae bacterium]
MPRLTKHASTDMWQDTCAVRPFPPRGNSSTATWEQQYHRGKTAVPPREYWSFPTVVLEMVCRMPAAVQRMAGLTRRLLRYAWRAFLTRTTSRTTSISASNARAA